MTSRYHDTEHKWIGGEEIRQWNKLNRKVKEPLNRSTETRGLIYGLTRVQACKNCLRSRTGRVCVIDEDQPNCRACRTNKIGCDRKPNFVFDLTKDEFFPTYDQFIRVYKNKEPGRLRRYVRFARRIPRDEGAFCFLLRCTPTRNLTVISRVRSPDPESCDQAIFWRSGSCG